MNVNAAGNVLTIEAENGTLNGVKVIDDNSASGGAYVDGFDSAEKSLVITADLPADATYQIRVKYKTYGGDKPNYIYLNGYKEADYTFKNSPGWNEAVIGQFKLHKGKNTMKIASWWGWIAVDYVQFIGGSDQPVKNVELSSDRGGSLASDTALELSAKADTSAEYRFFIRQENGEWKALNDYNQKPSYVWLPSDQGKYEFRVYARLVGSDVVKEAEDTINITVTAPYVNKPLLNPVYTNNMVLQRNKAVEITGWCEPDKKVTVDILNNFKSNANDKSNSEIKGSKSYSTNANENGEWSLKIGPYPAGGPYDMEIITEDKTVSLKNILFGEVWLCSGQSNMEFQLSNTLNAAEELEAADYPEIRYINIPNLSANTAQSLIDKNMRWKKTEPYGSSDFSAVAYFFAQKLYKELGVPIGIINASVGGTKAECWISYESLNVFPEFIEKVGDIRTGAIDIDATSSPTVLYNGMINPLISYNINGVLWYQGESNWGESVYYKLLPTLIADWRNKFNNSELPFIIDQISSFNEDRSIQSSSNSVEQYNGLPEVRDAQLNTVINDENAALVVTTDVGNHADIHPKNKQDVGYRSALSALGLVYKKELVYSGPIYKSMKLEGSKIRVYFDHVGSGLMIGKKEGLKPVVKVNDGVLKGFAIAGKDNQFHYAKAKIDGNTILVSADGIDNPTAVRYNWHNAPVGNLYNEEGLPASPFRTDPVYTLKVINGINSGKYGANTEVKIKAYAPKKGMSFVRWIGDTEQVDDVNNRETKVNIGTNYYTSVYAVFK